MADEDNDIREDRRPDPKTSRRRAGAGDVVKSQEVNTWFMIAGATLVLSAFSGSIGSGMQVPLRDLLANSMA